MTNVDPGSRSWQVTSQQQTAERMDDGNVLRGWNIQFRTGGNVTGTVFVPFPDANDPARVRAAVQAAADTAYDRGNLTG